MRIPETPPALQQLGSQAMSEGRFIEVVQMQETELEKNRYLHWDDLKYRKPPENFTREEWWLALKFRRLNQKKIPLIDKKGKTFGFLLPDLIVELLHQIDREGGTMIQLPEPVVNPAERDRYIVGSLMEEAITSSQLEGAATTRAAAKKMLTEGRAPRDKDERMILNNFITMRKICEWKDQPLTPELLLEIHRRISKDALDVDDGAGRFRRNDETIDVSDQEGQVFHLPPPAEELAQRVAAMCRFANGEIPDYFVHPVLRGIILHFWLAYDHPFVDGNGRTARALFYWQMMRADYWLFEFISISTILRKAPVQYGEAFLRTETDDNDLTYFILHQADVIRKSLVQLHDYVSRKSRETRATALLLNENIELNHRQQAILAHALRHPLATYQIVSHRSRHAISYDTARLDLLDLANRKLLDQKKSGKAIVFISPADLQTRIAAHQSQ